MKQYILAFWFENSARPVGFVGIRAQNKRAAEIEVGEYLRTVQRWWCSSDDVEAEAFLEPLTVEGISNIRENEQVLRYRVEWAGDYSCVECWDILRRLVEIIDDMEWSKKRGEDWNIFEG